MFGIRTPSRHHPSERIVEDPRKQEHSRMQCNCSSKKKLTALYLLLIWSLLSVCILLYTSTQSKSTIETQQRWQQPMRNWPKPVGKQFGHLAAQEMYERLLLGNKNSSFFVHGRKSLQRFRPRLSIQSLRSLIRLFSRVEQFCRQQNIIFMMYGGTLLGSYRHHGLVPWDDDADVFMPISLRGLFQKELLVSGTDIRLYTRSTHWKIWSYSDAQHINDNYGWPFIDVFFYEENATHIWDFASNHRELYTYSKDIVFPLHLRPFMGFWLPAPKDTAQFLAQTVIDPDGCHSPYYMHDLELPPDVSVATRCEFLGNLYPFAMKSVAQDEVGGFVESLVLKGLPLYSVRVMEPATSLTFNFSFRFINDPIGIKYAV